MELGYRLLAEAFIRQKRLDDAFSVLDKVPDFSGKSILLNEIRNNAVKTGNLDLYKKVSRVLYVGEYDFGDLASMLLTNVISKKLGPTIEIINMLPSGEIRDHLIITSIIFFAQHGSIIACEKIADACELDLTKDQALIAKTNAIREGWISDAQRAAEITGVKLTKQDYKIMMIANKDKGLLFDAQEAAKRAGEELDEMALITLLLSGVHNNRESVWQIAEMI